MLTLISGRWIGLEAASSMANIRVILSRVKQEQLGPDVEIIYLYLYVYVYVYVCIYLYIRSSREPSKFSRLTRAAVASNNLRTDNLVTTKSFKDWTAKVI